MVPYRIRKDRIEVALVTTSSGNGWVVPKGSLNEGEQPRAAAVREAEEEAGLLGVLARQPLGRYVYANGNALCEVDVYLMRVTEVLDRWPRRISGSVAGCACPMPKAACAKSCQVYPRGRDAGRSRRVRTRDLVSAELPQALNACGASAPSTEVSFVIPPTNLPSLVGTWAGTITNHTPALRVG